MLKRFLLLLLTATLFASCGTQDKQEKAPPQSDGPSNTELYKQILALQGEIASVIATDWATCDGALSAFVKNICNIANSASAETKTELQGRLNTLEDSLRTQIAGVATGSDVKLQAVWTQLYGVGYPETTGGATPTLAQCKTTPATYPILGCLTTIATAVETLVTQMAGKADQSALDDAIADITANTNDITSLDARLDAIETLVPGSILQTYDIGKENTSAGPTYETIIRKGDRSQVIGYYNGLTAKSSGNNPITATNGSPTVTVTTSAAHSMTAGDVVRLAGCTTGRGFSNGDLTGDFVLVTAPTGTTFTITLGVNATSGGTLGGTTCAIHKVGQSGLGEVWKTADGEVLKVAMASKAYNYLMTGAATTFGAAPSASPFTWVNNSTAVGAGYICYSKTDRSASAATIKAGGTNIVCK